MSSGFAICQFTHNEPGSGLIVHIDIYTINFIYITKKIQSSNVLKSQILSYFRKRWSFEVDLLIYKQPTNMYKKTAHVKDGGIEVRMSSIKKCTLMEIGENMVETCGMSSKLIQGQLPQ